MHIWFQNNSNVASVHLALVKLLWLTDPTLSQVKAWQNNQRIWDLVLLVETFCFSWEKALYTCSSYRPVSQPLLPGCAPRPFLLPCGHPSSDRCFNIDSLALYWRQWASAIVLRKRHFSTGKKRTKKKKNRRPCCLDGPASLSNLPRRREDVRACDAEAVCAVRASGSNAGSTGRKEGRAPLVFTLPLGRLDRENKL